MELDLLKILPFISETHVFWSPLFGNCRMHTTELSHYIDLECVEPEIIKTITIYKNGKYLRTGEIIVFPSRTNRNWENFLVQTLSIDTPVMCSNDGFNWVARYYYKDKKVFSKGQKSSNTSYDLETYNYIVITSFFNFKDLYSNIKYSINEKRQ